MGTLLGTEYVMDQPQLYHLKDRLLLLVILVEECLQLAESLQLIAMNLKWQLLMWMALDPIVLLL